MTDKIISIILFIVGVINLLPLIVFFDVSKTAKLYGVQIEGESLTILMRHRGVLLSLVGIALIAAAFKSEYRILAIALALISKIAFIFLTFSAASYTSEIKQVALIDVGAIVLLLLALGLHFYGK
ncbi:MAG: phosphopantetheine adenylyltransferase [Acidobacteriota bacterium]